MTRAELISALSTAGYVNGAWLLDDDRYDPVTREFVQQLHWAWVNNLPSKLRTSRQLGGGRTVAVPKWIPEVFDCDNIARDFATFIDQNCATIGYLSNPASGKLNFTLDNTAIVHARNWIVDPTGAAQCFDAGLGDWTPLSPTERASIASGESI